MKAGLQIDIDRLGTPAQAMVQGLHQHANERLGLYEAAKAQAQKLAQSLNLNSPPVQVVNNQQRPQVLRVGAYLNQDYLR